MDHLTLTKVSSDAAEKLHYYQNDNEGWETAKKTKDVIIERKHSTVEGFSHGHLYRGQTELNCSMETLFKYVNPVDGVLRKKWDKDIDDLTVLKMISEDLNLIRTSTNSAAMGLISPRDFIDVIKIERTDSSIFIIGVSVESEEYPPRDKFVRGCNHPCGILFASSPEKLSCTKVMSFVQADIKGMLPRSLVDSALPGSMAGFFANLRAILKKDGLLSS